LVQEEQLREQLAELRAKEAEKSSDIPSLIQEREECRCGPSKVLGRDGFCAWVCGRGGGGMCARAGEGRGRRSGHGWFLVRCKHLWKEGAGISGGCTHVHVLIHTSGAWLVLLAAGRVCWDLPCSPGSFPCVTPGNLPSSATGSSAGCGIASSP
jgi:hypothetical protein